MGQYTEQANRYSKNADKIIKLLDEAVIESKKIDGIMQMQNTNLDYLHDKIIKGNEEIQKRINKIQGNLDSNAISMQKKGKAIDERIEEERKARESKKNVTTGKDKTESGKTIRNITRKEEIDDVKRMLN